MARSSFSGNEVILMDIFVRFIFVSRPSGICGLLTLRIEDEWRKMKRRGGKEGILLRCLYV